MIKLAVSGCLGRMGQAITRLALQDKAFKLSALLERADHPQSKSSFHGIMVRANSDALKGSDVLIEFTQPEATIMNLKTCMQYGVRMVIGTTGLSADQINEIKKASKKIPIIFSSNMSVGVNIVFRLTQMVAEKTGSSYKFRITEAHHIHKKDSPSGTAKTIAEIAEKYSCQKIEKIDAIREGEIIGDHKITFESAEDIIAIEHHAKNRDIFAKGALVAAKFLKDKKTGLYDMQDVLGFK
jgi:4-hydroxy-tetrahydrodipicolinate reductase